MDQYTIPMMLTLALGVCSRALVFLNPIPAGTSDSPQETARDLHAYPLTEVVRRLSITTGALASYKLPDRFVGVGGGKPRKERVKLPDSHPRDGIVAWQDGMWRHTTASRR